ncbi:hypothetical protein MINTM021_39340 [Mycobacterium paraintracellulare]|nr:hypothetical protein MINTM021_39340 [Mycobacterium paraintracellulare]
MATTLLTDAPFSARVIPAYWAPVTCWTPVVEQFVQAGRGAAMFTLQIGHQLHQMIGNRGAAVSHHITPEPFVARRALPDRRRDGIAKPAHTNAHQKSMSHTTKRKAR